MALSSSPFLLPSLPSHSIVLPLDFTFTILSIIIIIILYFFICTFFIPVLIQVILSLFLRSNLCLAVPPTHHSSLRLLFPRSLFQTQIPFRFAKRTQCFVACTTRIPIPYRYPPVVLQPCHLLITYLFDYVEQGLGYYY